MRLNIAIVGSYGSGRTTLARALSQRTGLPIAYGSAMADPIGAEGKPVHDWSNGELLQLTVRRYGERRLAEAECPGGFVSDGSILHEPIYAKCRLAGGSYPADDDLAKLTRHPGVDAYEDVTDHIGLLAQAHAARAYDVVFHLPIEYPLHDERPPISEAFRRLSDTLVLQALDAADIRPRTLGGTVDQRVEQALAVLAEHTGTPASDPSPTGAGH